MDTSIYGYKKILITFYIKITNKWLLKKQSIYLYNNFTYFVTWLHNNCKANCYSSSAPIYLSFQFKRSESLFIFF